MTNISKDYILRKAKRFVYLSFIYIIAFGLAYMILYPYVVKITTSFMTIMDLTDATVMFIPRSITTFSWDMALQYFNLANSYLYSAYTALVIAIIQMVICAFIGYGFARYTFPGKNILFALVIFTMLVPFTTLIIPYFLRFRFFNLPFMQLNLINTIWPSVILASTGLGLKNGLYIYMFRQFFRAMPKELEEAAYIDGAGHFKTFFRIMLPNARASLLTVFLLSFSWQWTDVTFSRVFFSTRPIMANSVFNVLTVQNVLRDSVFISQMRNISTLLVILPIAILFFLLQRYFIQGIERSGITS